MKPNNRQVQLTDLEGKWFINQSNFPMWLKGDKKKPTFNYTIQNSKKGTVLLDVVQYVINGEIKRIKGIDHPLNNNNTRFLWRGKGLLKLLTSKWEILYIDTKSNWAIIYFEKTLFTPKGYDVISRKPTIENIQNATILDKLNELNITAKLTVIDHAISI